MSEEQRQHFCHVLERTERLLMILAHSSGLHGDSLAVISGTRLELKEMLQWLEAQQQACREQGYSDDEIASAFESVQAAAGERT